jgi:hypothetical protein
MSGHHTRTAIPAGRATGDATLTRAATESHSELGTFGAEGRRLAPARPLP